METVSQTLSMTEGLNADSVADLDFRVLLLLLSGEVEHLIIEVSAAGYCDRAVLAGLYRIRGRLAAHRVTLEITGVKPYGHHTTLTPTELEAMFTTCDAHHASDRPLTPPPRT